MKPHTIHNKLNETTYNFPVSLLVLSASCPDSSVVVVVVVVVV
jgi:hypothetical protein